MDGQPPDNTSNRDEASSFLMAMNQLNQRHPPDRVARPSYQTLLPNSPVPPTPQTFGMTTSPISPDVTAVMPQESVTLPIFQPHFQAQIAALRAMPDAERREKNRLLTCAKSNEFHQLLHQKEALVKVRQSFGPEAFVKHYADLQVAMKVTYAIYVSHFCLTFRINDLPVEILTAIFRLTVNEEGDSDVRAAIRVTHVCRLWRSVAIADRDLWNPIRFLDPKNFERSFALMERAGATGLEIRIRDIDTKPLSKEAMTRLIDRIFKKLPSIRKMDIFLYSREAVLPILEGLQRVAQDNHTMELEHLEIHNYYASGTPTAFLPSLPLFGGSILPSFRHLRLNGVNIQWDVALLSRLTTLDLRRLAMELLPSSAIFRAVLSGATGLEKLILDAAGPRHEPSTPPLPPIAIPSLRILVLGGLSDAYAEYVLSHFSAPNVLDFTIMFPVDNVYSRLISALTTSSRMSNIKILILVRMPFGGTTIPAESKLLLGKWLESMPELTFLRVIETSRDIFEVLRLKPPEARHTQASAQRRPIGPNIVYVDFQNDSELTDIDHLVNYIVFRRALGYLLKKVWLTSGTVARLSTEQKLKLKQALGVGVVQIASWRTVEEEALCKQV